MFVIPAADWLDIIIEIGKELLSGCGNVPAERLRVVPFTEKNNVVELQEPLEASMAEEVDVLSDHCIEEFIELRACSAARCRLNHPAGNRAMR